MELYDKIKYICKNTGCGVCPIRRCSCPISVYAPSDWPAKEDLNEIVDKWIEEHPVKTRKSEFLKTFPNCNLVMSYGGFVDICPRTLDSTLYTIDYCAKADCIACKKKYWSEEVE